MSNDNTPETSKTPRKPLTDDQKRLHNEANRRYRKRHPEKIKQIVKRDNEMRRDKKTVWAREDYQQGSKERREVLRARGRRSALRWAENNRQKSRTRAHEYYWANRDKILANARNDRVRKAAYIRGRRRNQPAVRLISNLRVRLWHALKRTNARRSNRTLALVGCSVAFLRTHLESQFKVGMSWDNYGEWHVDHIRPCASFNLSDPIQQRICFHYSNLQPLWEQENHIKSAKLI